MGRDVGRESRTSRSMIRNGSCRSWKWLRVILEEDHAPSMASSIILEMDDAGFECLRHDPKRIMPVWIL
jgi:hypothetical protein